MGLADLLEMIKRNGRAKVEYIIAALGNPGQRYENTRHNAGFMALDRLCSKNGLAATRRRFAALCGEGVIAGNRVLIMKPQTYMNNSGESVRAAADWYGVPAQRVLVICDDVSLDLGRVRIRKKGSDGGHNGLKSIIACIGSQDFPRIRIGVGAKPHPDCDLADWVLGALSASERKALEPALENAAAAVEMIVGGRIEEAMNRFNGAAEAGT